MKTELLVPQIKVRSNVRAGSGGGWVDGVWYPDKSGVCGGSTPQPPSGGGWVDGVWYPDKSGSCG